MTTMQDLDSKYGFSALEDIAALKAGADVKSLKCNEIKYSCKSFSDLQRKAEQTKDVALKGKISVHSL